MYIAVQFALFVRVVLAVQFALPVRVVLAVSYVVLAVSPMWLSLSNLLWFVRSVLRVSMRAARACVGVCLCASLHAWLRVRMRLCTAESCIVSTDHVIAVGSGEPETTR